MITDVKVIGISKNTSNRFGKHSYLINQERKENGLIVGQKLTYGYLQTSVSLGAKEEAWFIANYSMCEYDFDNYWILKNGSKKVKID
jgi:hypothetical protein